MPCRLAGKPAKYFGPDHRPRRAHTSLRDLGLLRGGTQRLTADWYSAPYHTDDDGERPPPVGQAGQIPAADVPLDLRAQLGGPSRGFLEGRRVCAARRLRFRRGCRVDHAADSVILFAGKPLRLACS